MGHKGAGVSFPSEAAMLGIDVSKNQLVAALFAEPGDWAWLRRMVRLGVRMGMVDDVVVDYYPSQLWGTPARPRGLLG